MGFVEGGRSVAAAQQGDAALRRQRAGLGLVAECGKGCGVRPDEGDARGFQPFCELGVFAQEPVPRMHRVAAVGGGQGNELFDVQIGGCAAPLQRHRLIGLKSVQGGSVFRRVNGVACNAEIGGGPGNADGDFAPVGDQQSLHVE